MAKTLAFLVGASAIALVSMATVPQPASAGSHVGVEVGPGGVYIGPRHRHYYDDDDWRWRRHDHRGAYWDRDYRRHHNWD
jgi:hypothetical protein